MTAKNNPRAYIPPDVRRLKSGDFALGDCFLPGSGNTSGTFCYTTGPSANECNDTGNTATVDCANVGGTY